MVRTDPAGGKNNESSFHWGHAYLIGLTSNKKAIEIRPWNHAKNEIVALEHVKEWIARNLQNGYPSPDPTRLETKIVMAEAVKETIRCAACDALITYDFDKKVDGLTVCPECYEKLTFHGPEQPSMPQHPLDAEVVLGPPALDVENCTDVAALMKESQACALEVEELREKIVTVEARRGAIAQRLNEVQQMLMASISQLGNRLGSTPPPPPKGYNARKGLITPGSLASYIAQYPRGKVFNLQEMLDWLTNEKHYPWNETTPTDDTRKARISQALGAHVGTTFIRHGIGSYSVMP
jgi:hypothetical protein